MPTKKKVEPADADTVIRAMRQAAEALGWGASGSSVSPEGEVVVSARLVPEATDEDQE
jgi:hypothetical protein